MGPLSVYSRFNMEVCEVKEKVAKVYSDAWLTHLSTEGLLRSWMFGWKCHPSLLASQGVWDVWLEASPHPLASILKTFGETFHPKPPALVVVGVQISPLRKSAKQ